MSKPELSILMPTHNRETFQNALDSVRAVFSCELKSGFAEIIVGDNSSLTYEAVKTISKRDKKITYLDNRGEMQYTNFLEMLDFARGNYVLIVEDDDVLKEGEDSAHAFIMSNWKTLTSNDSAAISYPWVKVQRVNVENQEKLRVHIRPQNDSHEPVLFLLEEMIQFPTMWNGSYQIGCSYIKTSRLRSAAYHWFYTWNLGEDNKGRIFSPEAIKRAYSKDIDGSNDEALYILSIWSQPTVYVNLPGLVIGEQGDNSSWGNPPMSLYSSRSYINELCDWWKCMYPNVEVDTVNAWRAKMEGVVLRELQTLFDFELKPNNIFNSDELHIIESNVIRWHDAHLIIGCDPNLSKSERSRLLVERYVAQYIEDIKAQASKTRSR